MFLFNSIYFPWCVQSPSNNESVLKGNKKMKRKNLMDVLYSMAFGCLNFWNIHNSALIRNEFPHSTQNKLGKNAERRSLFWSRFSFQFVVLEFIRHTNINTNTNTIINMYVVQGSSRIFEFSNRCRFYFQRKFNFLFFFKFWFENLNIFGHNDRGQSIIQHRYTMNRKSRSICCPMIFQWFQCSFQSRCLLPPVI